MRHSPTTLLHMEDTPSGAIRPRDQGTEYISLCLLDTRNPFLSQAQDSPLRKAFKQVAASGIAQYVRASQSAQLEPQGDPKMLQATHLRPASGTRAGLALLTTSIEQERAHGWFLAGDVVISDTSCQVARARARAWSRPGPRLRTLAFVPVTLGWWSL